MADPAGPEAQAHLLSEPFASTIEDLAARLGVLARERGVTIGTAESCTGGLVGHGITSAPGSSAYYLGGIVSYADAVKIELLGVPASTLERHGAVSAQVAVAMAMGIRERVGCDIGVAVTGIAGPEGGSAARPVGLTYVATAADHGHEVRRYLWNGDRRANAEASTVAALGMLIEVLEAAAGTLAAETVPSEPPGEPAAPG
jgi:PncC family amidohydrolase